MACGGGIQLCLIYSSACPILLPRCSWHATLAGGKLVLVPHYTPGSPGVPSLPARVSHVQSRGAAVSFLALSVAVQLFVVKLCSLF
eukprot:1154048-Pelagomonas_calceolata.AAC.1